MIKTYRFRMKPTSKQASSLNKTVELCRNLYNCALEQRISQRISKFEQMRQLTEVRKSDESYRTVHVHILQNVIKDLDLNFQAFFRRLKEGQKPGHPRFKSSKRYNHFSSKGSGYGIEGKYLVLSKIGKIKLFLHRAIPSTAVFKSCLIKKYREKWFVSISVDLPPSPLVFNCKKIGIDVGIEHFAALSDGSFIANPKIYVNAQRKLRKSQRQANRKKKGSHKRVKAFKLVGLIHAKIVNQRKDFLHKESRNLIRNFGTLAVERLNISGLSRGLLSKSIYDASWGKFFSFLSYKAEEAGREFIKVDARYTSQTCPNCGVIKKKLLSERIHKCLCGSEMHRDTAAAKIILARAEPSGAKTEGIPSYLA